MLRVINIIGGFSVSLSAAAATYRPVKVEVPLQNVTVENTNAGINPDARAYIVSGQVTVASNSCFARGLHATLRIENQSDGVQHVVAYVEGRQRSDLICIEIYQPVLANVSTTVRGDYNLADTVNVRNAEEMGTLRPLSSFTANSVTERCDKRVFCTREYLPTTCSFNGLEFNGNNRCESLVAAKRNACINRIEFLAEEVECQSSPSE